MFTKVFFVPDVTLLATCHCEFAEFGGKLKKYTRSGPSSLLLPRNKTQSHGNW